MTCIKSLALSILTGTIVCSFFFSNQTAAAPDKEARAAELDSKLNEIAAERAISKKELTELKIAVMSIAATRDRLALATIRKSCGEEIQLHCSSDRTTSATLNCIKAKRDQTSERCESELNKQFGGKPIPTDQFHLGIPIPKGSIFRYNHHGRIAGVIAADNIRHNGIHFKKGSISFHETGISVGRLVADQYIDGIEYLASGLGPFFNEEGNVVNATLASDTEIAGIVYMADQQITFHSKGRVESGRVAQETTAQGEVYLPGDMIRFNKDNTIRKTRKLNLYKPPERDAEKKSSDYVGLSFVTSRPLAYKTGLPRYNEIKHSLRDSYFAIYSDDADRKITQLTSRCSGCMTPDKLTTPIRIEYIPSGTTIKVVGEYLYKSDSIFSSDIPMLIVTDEQGNNAEISQLGFELDIAKTYTGRYSRETNSILKNIESFNNKGNIRLSYCLHDFEKNSPEPAKFIRDFQLEAEVDITHSNAMCDDGFIFEFKTLTSYLTSNYYFKAWGLFGKWSAH